jgi:hypothetical protein
MAALEIQAPPTLNGGGVEKGLPSMKGPLAWTGEEFASGKPFELDLKDDIKELDSALKHFKELNLTENDISPQTFPLTGALEARLRDVTKEIHSGRGFLVLKGLGGHFESEDGVKIFLALASYIADQRGRQDKHGNVLSHITSSKSWTVPMNERHGIHSNAALPFHNDMGCDILALQVRDVAEEGGLTYLSSAWSVYNRLASQEPAVLETLLAPKWPVQISGREARFYLASAFAVHEGKLMTSMDPNRFGPHPNSKTQNTPRLTAAQEYALERVSAVACEVELGLRLEQGDVLFFNNWALLHRRDSYTDGDASRHLVRLWLRDSQAGWSVPEAMLPPWAAAYGDEQAAQPVYAMNPDKEYKKSKYTAGSAAFVIEEDAEKTA